jgi:hypothetical protein
VLQELRVNWQQLVTFLGLKFMIKIKTKKVDKIPFSELIIYSSLTRIPFTLNMNQDSILPTTNYARNLSGGNFIELGFNKSTKQLYNITMVMIQNDTVTEVSEDISLFSNLQDNMFFTCYLEDDSRFEITKPMHIIRDKKSLSIIWDNEILNHFRISTNCLIGLNCDNYLSSVTVDQINQEALFEIFGF